MKVGPFRALVRTRSERRIGLYTETHFMPLDKVLANKQNRKETSNIQ